MSKKETDEAYSHKEAARRRDAVIKNMINTPPTPHKQKAKGIPKAKKKPKRRSASK